MATQSGKQKKVMGRVMHEFKHGELKSGTVKPVSRDELVAHFREKSASRRIQSGE